MLHRHRSAMTCSLGCVAVTLSALVSAQAETVNPDRITYDAKVNEDGAAKVCMLDFAVKDHAVGDAILFQLVVARTKRNDVLAGPTIYGFTIEVHDPQLASGRGPLAAGREITSAAFASDRYTASARPKAMPFADGSWVASTVDSKQGDALVDGVVEGKFQIAYTRTRPVAARTYQIASAPPPEVLSRFNRCVERRQSAE